MTALRCAIYTRKSSEEGLEQDFNSLEAQREACEAYIRSQSHEGWRLLPGRFDDGGFSGGNTDRPALRNLLSEIETGRVDIVVVYKIDRLTRSLGDFARLAETFDRQKVSFVSVTQQFNTTSSMGRLMLNVLLSFAQFEREITGERIRDKIAASKRKGMWMGGTVPMGYDVVDRRLVPNADAELVRRIFALYLEVGTVPALVKRLADLGLRTPQRHQSGNRPFGRGHLYRVLSNPLYVGKVAHKGTIHLGQHEPILDAGIWEAVQNQLSQNTQGSRQRQVHRTTEAMLAGRLFSDDRNAFAHSYATKGSRRYRYYVEQQSASSGSRPLRLPAAEIERAVVGAIASYLSDEKALVTDLAIGGHEVSSVLASARQLADQLRAHPERVDLGGVVAKVVCGPDDIKVHCSRAPLLAALGAKAQPAQQSEIVVVRAGLSIRRRGRQAKVLISGQGRDGRDATLQLAVARAAAWVEALATGAATTVKEIADANSVTEGYVRHLLPLAFLAPEIVEQIILGTQRADVSADELTSSATLPPEWGRQRWDLM